MNLLSTKTAAEKIGVSVRTLNRLAEAGKITAAWKGEGKRGGYLYEPAEVKRVAAERRTTWQATAHLCKRCGIDTTVPGLCADCSEVA